MRSFLLVVVAVSLSSCAATSYTKEEVSAAFAERDAALAVIIEALDRCGCYPKPTPTPVPDPS
jgi:hypothetical protein